jgi:hypothetical protein
MSDAPSLAFETPAGNLHPGDADRFDIFVRDLASSATALASRAGGAGGAKGDADSRVPSISANGRRVAFESTLGKPRVAGHKRLQRHLRPRPASEHHDAGERGGRRDTGERPTAPHRDLTRRRPRRV